MKKRRGSMSCDRGSGELGGAGGCCGCRSIGLPSSCSTVGATASIGEIVSQPVPSATAPPSIPRGSTSGARGRDRVEYHAGSARDMIYREAGPHAGFGHICPLWALPSGRGVPGASFLTMLLRKKRQEKFPW